MKTGSSLDEAWEASVELCRGEPGGLSEYGAEKRGMEDTEDKLDIRRELVPY